jgi:hypothetical protein
MLIGWMPPAIGIAVGCCGCIGIIDAGCTEMVVLPKPPAAPPLAGIIGIVRPAELAPGTLPRPVGFELSAPEHAKSAAPSVKSHLQRSIATTSPEVCTPARR